MTEVVFVIYLTISFLVQKRDQTNYFESEAFNYEIIFVLRSDRKRSEHGLGCRAAIQLQDAVVKLPKCVRNIKSTASSSNLCVLTADYRAREVITI